MIRLLLAMMTECDPGVIIHQGLLIMSFVLAFGSRNIKRVSEHH